jgi:general secretion pathway protein D
MQNLVNSEQLIVYAWQAHRQVWWRALMVVLFGTLLISCTTLIDPTQDIHDVDGHYLDPTTNTPPLTNVQEQPANGLALSDRIASAPRNTVEQGTGRFVRQISPAQPDTVAGDVTLNFDNTDIREVVKVILGDLLAVNYVLDPAVQGSVSLQTGRPLRRDLLVPTLETLLRMNNAALIHKGDRYEIVPLANAMRGRLSPQLGETDRPLPQGYAIRIVPLQYIGAQEMASILEPLAPEGSLIRVDSLRNLLVLAAAGPEMTNLLQTIDTFDVDWMAGLSVGFFSLEYAKTQDVINQLKSLLADEKQGNPFDGLFRFIAVESANAVLVVSPQADYLEKIQEWIARLDLAEASGSTAQQLYVYRVKHGDAENLADILGRVFGGDGVSGGRTVGSVAPGKTETTLSSNNGQAASSASETRRASSSQVELSAAVNIVADPVNNSLLVKANPRDYRKILDALKQLDILPLQVLVEATIVEVKLTGSLRYGIQWQFFTGGKDGYDHQTLLTQSDQGGAPQIFPGFNWSVILSPDTIRSTLSALASNGLVNVLSSPSVMVLDNQEAKIQVGEQVPVATAQQQGTTVTDRIVNQIEYRDIGVMLTVKPKVTPGGLVQMEIEQEVSTVAKETGALNSPTFRTRNITSHVAVRSNQAVVLGGLIQNTRENGKSGIPGMYRVPVVGALFGETNRSAERTELVVILTPRVIASDGDIETVTATFRNKVKNLQGKF